jgi:cold shock CspA family protein
MAIGVIKSFELDQGLIIVKLDGRSPEVALHVSGSDKATVASLMAGHQIRFDFARGRRGQVFAIDVIAQPGLSRDIGNSGRSPPVQSTSGTQPPKANERVIGGISAKTDLGSKHSKR